MLIENAPVIQTYELENSVFIIKIHSPEIARQTKPGQFCNIKVSNSTYPLLRRPFSICEVDGDTVSFMFTVYGEGTKLLAHKKIGETLDVLGPLGNGFNLSDDYETAVIVAGGIGAAPFALVTKEFAPDKKVFSFIGARSAKDVITYGMKNVLVATDDGSKGFHGNVIQLMENNLHLFKDSKVKVFGCGPTPMLRALKEFCIKYNLNCEVSTESAMACGFGICQGCPIQSAKETDKYFLICKDGPVFNIDEVII